jgi:hypothetical protein
MVPNGQTERFLFISPHITPIGEKKFMEDKSKRVADILYAHRDTKKLIMAPHNVR